ncbi:hypothetical protein [Burkholderia ambifaria]|nr:hypothetical protein [Burkholderia ambifaria]
MSTRIQQTFAALAEQGRKGLIPFITAGDPDPQRRSSSCTRSPKAAPT